MDTMNIHDIIIDNKADVINQKIDKEESNIKSLMVQKEYCHNLFFKTIQHLRNSVELNIKKATDVSGKIIMENSQFYLNYKYYDRDSSWILKIDSIFNLKYSHHRINKGDRMICNFPPEKLLEIVEKEINTKYNFKKFNLNFEQCEENNDYSHIIMKYEL